MRWLFRIFALVLATGGAPAQAAEAFSCEISQIRDGVRLDDVILPNLQSGNDRQEIALTDGGFKIRVWTYVSVLGIDIIRGDAVIAQSRTAETDFSFAELWYHPEGRVVAKDATWVICSKAP